MSSFNSSSQQLGTSPSTNMSTTSGKSPLPTRPSVHSCSQSPGDMDLEAQIKVERHERLARRMMVVVKLLILFIMVVAPLVCIVRGAGEQGSSARLVTRGWKNPERNDQLAYIIAISLCGGFAFFGIVGAAYWVNKRKSGDDNEVSSEGVDASEGKPRKGLFPIWAQKWFCL